MKHLFPLFAAVLLLTALPAGSRVRHYVDYRYAPEWFQSTTCFPDDYYKTMVGPCGQLLYEYSIRRPGFFPSAGKPNGYQTVLFLQADENQRLTGTSLRSAKAPIVEVDWEIPGLEITQQIYSTSASVQSHEKMQHPLKTDREDVVLFTVRNRGRKADTINPLLIINSSLDVQVDGRVVTIDSIKHFTLSLEPVLTRKNLGEKRTVIHLEPVSVPAHGTVTFAGIYDNGIPSALSQKMLSSPRACMSLLPGNMKQVERWWNKESDIPYGCIKVPDTEIQNLLEASMRGIWQAREIIDGSIRLQVGPTRYRGLWIVDGAFISEATAILGHGQDARSGIEYSFKFQRPTGQFAKLRDDFYKENGIILWTSVRHAMLTQDKEWLLAKWEMLSKTADYIHVLRQLSYENPFPEDDGLIPPGYVDGGMSGGKDKPEYSNTVWCLSGLKAMISAARWLSKEEDANRWQTEYDDFIATFMAAANRDLDEDDFGNKYLNNFVYPEHRSLPQRAQWAFCQSIYPGQIFEKGDPVAKGTLEMMDATLQDGMVMGTGWNINGVWGYFASFYGHAWLWNGSPDKAVDALYSFANHASPLYAWREEHNPKDVTQRYGGDMPHNWGSAEFIRLAAHLLQIDRGTELHLLEGIPREWLKPGMETSLDKMATPFGPLTMSLKVSRSGRSARLAVSALSDNCTKLAVHLGRGVRELDPCKENRIRIKLH